MATPTDDAADFFQEFVHDADPTPSDEAYGRGDEEGATGSSTSDAPGAPNAASAPQPTGEGSDSSAGLGRGLFLAGGAALAALIGVFLWLSTGSSDPQTVDEEVVGSEPALDETAESTEPTSSGLVPESEAGPESSLSFEAETEAEAGGEAGIGVDPEPAAVDMVVSGDRLTLDGRVGSADVAESLFIAVSQLAGADTTVENNLIVDEEAGINIDLALLVDDAVLFDTGSAELSSGFTGMLDAVVAMIDLIPDTNVVVSGHTDIVGSEEANQVLSLARAQAVVDYLDTVGVDAARLEAVGLGSSQPVADNSTPDGRQANRRIEIEIVSGELAE